MIRHFFLFLVSSIAWTVTANATVTLQFSQTFSGGIASGFSTQSGVAGVDGLRWGIVIDTTGNGFNGGSPYGALPTGSNAAAFMTSDGSSATDDYFFPASVLTADFSALLEGDFTTTGATGTIDEITGVPFGTNGIGLGDRFALIWYDSGATTSGAYYGLFTDPAFTIPGDGSTEPSYAAVFTGIDPVRNANIAFGGAAVPEPSRMMLALFGIGLVGLRRRR